MPKQNPCSILELGKISNFRNVTLLSGYIKVDPETCRRWRRELKESKKPMVKYHDGILIDFEPTIHK